MIGSTVGNYRIEAELGRGGMGVVYRAVHVSLGRPAALKMLLPQFSADPTIVQRFFNEARTASAIRHPGIVEIYEAEEHTDGSAYIAMALLAGQSLEQRLRDHHRLDVSEAIQIAYQVAGALAAAHGEHVVHRDLKPDNIFLVPDDDMPGGVRTKLLDFGIAKLVGAEALKLTAAGMMMGTPLYMSPEQCRGADEVDHRTDLYALGCVLFHMLCGRPPFTGTSVTAVITAHLSEPPVSPASLEPRVPPSLDELVLRLLHKDRAARIQSAADVRAALKQLGEAPAEVSARELTAPPSQLAPTPAWTTPGVVVVGAAPTIPKPRRGRWLIVAGVVALGAIGALVLTQRGPSTSKAPAIIPSLAVGSDHSCVLRSGGDVRCWGDGDFGRTSPPELPFLAISAAGTHTCGLRQGNTIVCWGADTTRLDGTFQQVSVGEGHTCALAEDQTIRCNGSNLDGQARAPGGRFRFVATGPRETCAIGIDGDLTCWGMASAVRLPVGPFTQVTVGRGFGCALDGAGAVVCWGVNNRGQASPPRGTFTSVLAAEHHACGLRNDQSIQCWGEVVAAPPAGRFVAVAIGPRHGCALELRGGIACWGDDTKGQSTPPALD